MAANSVTFYSNGIADFQRTYQVPAAASLKISLPVRKDHIADVLASLNVFGPVQLSSAPSFRPANESSGTLTIDAHKAIEDVAVKLAGGRVYVEKPTGAVEGVLVGLHVEPEGKLGERMFPKSLVVQTPDGIVKVPLRDVVKLKFLDADAQKEIDKALQRNFEQIKPQSTFVDLKVASEGDAAEVTLQYTLPTPAWKITYRLHDREAGGHDFHGYAIVDNNTEEDWTDFLVSVVTGEPTTFETDLAEQKSPRRSRINVVQGEALGAVEVEQVLLRRIAMAPAAGADASEDYVMAPAGGTAVMRKSRGFAKMDSMAADMAERKRAAEIPEAEAKEVGDFCVYSAKSPVSIGGNRSAVIPMFQAALGQTKSILHYRAENHAERPFRAIKFINETPFSLGRGVCTVYLAGAYAGTCILPATSPGADCLLPHALETGVRVSRDQKRERAKVVSLNLSEGACQTRRQRQRQTAYGIKNLRPETFELVLDHDAAISESQVEIQVVGVDGKPREAPAIERLKFGTRITLKLSPQDEIRVTVHESIVDSTVVQFVEATAGSDDVKVHWFAENVVAINDTLANHPEVRKCLEIKTRIDEKTREIGEAAKEKERLAQKQDRVRKNLAAAGQDEQSAQWRVDLGKIEDRITAVEEQTIPHLRAEEATLKAELRTALWEIAASWNAEA